MVEVQPVTDTLTIAMVAKLDSLDKRLSVIENSGIWKATHDASNAIVGLRDSYERIVGLVDTALRAVRHESVNAEKIRELEEEVRRLKKGYPLEEVT